MNHHKITRLESLEIDLGPDFENEVSFPQNLSTLEKGIIESIEAYHAGVIAFTPGKKATINETLFNKGFLKLHVGNEDRIGGIPLYTLNPKNNNGIAKEFSDLRIDFSKSKIIFGEGTGFVANERILLIIKFRKNGD